MDMFRLAPGECRGEIRMKTIKEWSENEGRREERREEREGKEAGSLKKKG